MTLTAPLLTATHKFVALYQANKKLSDEQFDWSCVLHLQPSDGVQGVAVKVVGGVVESVTQSEIAIDLVVTASLDILLEILELKLNPNQPYLFGELTVVGAEEHFMRLDYIVTMLCPG
jgi:putative sterol carrier protein